LVGLFTKIIGRCLFSCGDSSMWPRSLG